MFFLYFQFNGELQEALRADAGQMLVISSILCFFDGCSMAIVNRMQREIPRIHLGWILYIFFSVALGHYALSELAHFIVGSVEGSEGKEFQIFLFRLLVVDGVLFLFGHAMHHLFPDVWDPQSKEHPHGKGWLWQGLVFIAVDKLIVELLKPFTTDYKQGEPGFVLTVRLGIKVLAASVDGVAHGALIIAEAEGAPTGVIHSMLLLFGIGAGASFVLTLLIVMFISPSSAHSGCCGGGDHQHGHGDSHDHGHGHDHHHHGGNVKDLIAVALLSGLMIHNLVEMSGSFFEVLQSWGIENQLKATLEPWSALEVSYFVAAFAFLLFSLTAYGEDGKMLATRPFPKVVFSLGVAALYWFVLSPQQGNVTPEVATSTDSVDDARLSEMLAILRGLTEEGSDTSGAPLREPVGVGAEGTEERGVSPFSIPLAAISIEPPAAGTIDCAKAQDAFMQHVIAIVTQGTTVAFSWDCTPEGISITSEN